MTLPGDQLVEEEGGTAEAVELEVEVALEADFGLPTRESVANANGFATVTFELVPRWERAAACLVAGAATCCPSCCFFSVSRSFRSCKRLDVLNFGERALVVDGTDVELTVLLAELVADAGRVDDFFTGIPDALGMRD